jgi:hypothetical protein
VVLAVVGIGVAVTTLPGELRTRVERGSPDGGDRALLLDILAELKRSWMQEDQRHALDRAVANAAVIEQPLAWLLEQPRHEYVPQALQVAAELKLRSLLDRVEALARVPALRAKALKCSDSIEPLPTIVIEELLHNEEREVVLAGVEILARRTPQPSAMLIPLLAHEDPEVRRAAAVALPDPLPSDVVPALMKIAQNREPLIAILGIEALSRPPRTWQVEEFFASRLLHEQDTVVTAALRALSRNHLRLSPATAAQLWKMVDTTSVPEIEALAFQCLEKTRSYSIDEVRGRLSGMDAEARYYASRLLLARGDNLGLETLQKLTAEIQGDERLTEIAGACRAVLSELSGMEPSSELGAFRDYFAANPPRGQQKLPPPPGR